MNHDERFKVLLREFLREFFELFFPELAGLDFSKADWQPQELIGDPPRGEKRIVDLLVKIPFLTPAGAMQFVHIHLEVESDDTVEPLRRRMYEYCHYLTHVLNLDVLPVAIYLSVGLLGRGLDVYEVHVLGRRQLRFEYDYVGLPGLDGAAFLNQPNVLGVALSALMRWPQRQRAEAAVEALTRLVASQETPRRKLLLCDCVNSYAPLDEEQRVQLNSLLQDPTRREVQMFGKTWEEQGIEKGIEKGQRQVLRLQLDYWFGPLSETAQQRLANWPEDKLSELACSLREAKSLKDIGLED